MHTVPESSRPASFHVAAAGSDVSGLFADSQHTVTGRAPNDLSTTRRRLDRMSQRRTYLEGASVWWDNWVPIATTGWGAVIVIAPLLAAEFLIRAAGALFSSSAVFSSNAQFSSSRGSEQPDATGWSAP